LVTVTKCPKVGECNTLRVTPHLGTPEKTIVEIKETYYCRNKRDLRWK
jgi:hypothetical protein